MEERVSQRCHFGSQRGRLPSRGVARPSPQEGERCRSTEGGGPLGKRGTTDNINNKIV